MSAVAEDAGQAPGLREPWSTTSRTSLVALAAVVCSLPFLLILHKILTLGVNVPFSDQWELVLFVQEREASTLSLGDFWAQHGEQRIFFPRLVMMGLAILSDWDVRLEFLVNLALAAGLYGFLALLVWRSFGSSLHRWTVVLLAALSVLVFSPIQWENWFWGWQISWFLSIFGAVGGITILALWPPHRRAWMGVTLAASAVIIGHLSLTSGGLAWVAALPVFFFRKHLRRWVWLWVGFGAVVWGVYFIDYARYPQLGDENLYRPSSYFAYTLYYLARPFLREGHIIRVGLTLLGMFGMSAAFLMAFRREQLEKAAPWLSIGVYAATSAAATSFNRVGLGLWQAGSSRYTTMATLFVISTSALVALAIPPDLRLAGRRFRLGTVAPALAVWVVVAGVYLVRYPAELKAMDAWAVERGEIKRCLIRAEAQTDPCLVKAYPAPQVVFERTQILEKVGWAGFEN